MALYVPLLVFVSVCSAGLTLVGTQRDTAREETRRDAKLLAEETGVWFSRQLDKALLPLFSLQQFVFELEEFRELPQRIGAWDDPGSLPLLSPPLDGTTNVPTHRNVTAVCTNPVLVQRFDKIASRIKETADMKGILVNLQLAPHAVVCLLHPLNNTEDFPDGVYMDNSGALGHDLLQDPERKIIARSTILSKQVQIVGPLTLRQCTNCDPIVEKGFIARLPIPSHDDHVIANDAIEYPQWGFAVAIINWVALIENSNLHQNFQQRGMTFHLTRTDYSEATETGRLVEKIEVLAAGPHWESFGGQTVTVALSTTNNKWKMTVGYNNPSDLPHVFAASLAVIVSAFLSSLIFTILAQKQINSDLRAEEAALLLENAEAAANTERNLNEYISHEIRNPLSVAITASSFITTAIKDHSPGDTNLEVSATVEDMELLNHSLLFIDELLRTMLDVHRVSSQQFELNMKILSVESDILIPVAKLVRHRSNPFKVLIECPKELTIRGDRVRLQQIMLNLARNATKFTINGFVRLGASVSDHGRMCLFVEDSGPGIPKERRNCLFKRYQDSLDSVDQGTGMGMYLCKKLVDLMGGDIYLDESFDSGIPRFTGTRFVVDLGVPTEIVPSTIPEKDSSETRQQFEPCRKVSTDDGSQDTNTTVDSSVAKLDNTPIPCESGSAGEVDHTAPTESQPNDTNLSNDEERKVGSSSLPKNWSILFVDDNSTLRKLSKRSLQKVAPSWRLAEASSGEMALAMASEEEYDLIFMDEYMTSVGHSLKGTETTRQLRAKGCTKSVICGLSANDLGAAFLNSGADDFWLKPFPCRADDLRQHLLHLKTLYGSKHGSSNDTGTNHRDVEVEEVGKNQSSVDTSRHKLVGVIYAKSNNDAE